MNEPLIDFVMRAREGDKKALEEVVRGLQDRVFGLSLRMLYHPSDAEDVTQEILIKIVTHLGSFRGEGSFRAWAMKIAVNHLLSVRRKRAEINISYEDMASRIVNDWGEPWRELTSRPMQNLIVEEFRIACLQVVLLGLDRPHRLAYILGEVFEVSGREGAEALDIRESAFRKRLQRARSRIRTFLQTNCALIRPENPCICERQTDYFLSTGQMNPEKPVFIDHPCHMRHAPPVLERLEKMDELTRVSFLFKTHPGLKAPESFVGNLRKLVDSKKFEFLRQEWATA